MNFRKEMTTMKYEKPVVFVLAPAADAIQGHKGISTVQDSRQYTVAAYEADE
jgi:hypothetical protein